MDAAAYGRGQGMLACRRKVGHGGVGPTGTSDGGKSVDGCLNSKQRNLHNSFTGCLATISNITSRWSNLVLVLCDSIKAAHILQINMLVEGFEAFSLLPINICSLISL
ncbi:hypothetical protein SAY87_025776 [Trapa incisa]|uniref:Uncharacterized protein n=1 Tax=Trapa incisa TaxID=236973 RepID=A0AAN7JJE3_9MYRT|nr:hypothetical protein SAY87_025776 [Trapa incisa]